MSRKILTDVDFHDARVGHISIYPGGRVEIEFNHICTYHDQGEGAVEVWSSIAVIMLYGVHQFELSGLIGDKDYVSEGGLLDEQSLEVSLLPLESEKQASSFYLLFAGSGTNARFSIKAATLIKLNPIRKLDDLE